MYCGITEAPYNFRHGNGDMLTYSDTSAHWLWNRVSNFAYLRYNYMIVDINSAQGELENGFLSQVPTVDITATQLYKTSPSNARAYLTSFSSDSAATAFNRWKELDSYLLVKYMDGNVKLEENGMFMTNGYGQPAFPDQPGFPQWYLDDIVAATGDLHLYLYPSKGAPAAAAGGLGKARLRKM
eukprot:TRINITY_DN105_c0_g1_i4.p2 TRINITY_DN105_c0_g1~~TRINITY_DN105_c0_g1_i4.p2  ORF type:complete len:183 (-),score=64.81 TRINITY_DN105_c0_g1_i4:70-618(-)